MENFYKNKILFVKKAKLENVFKLWKVTLKAFKEALFVYFYFQLKVSKVSFSFW